MIGGGVRDERYRALISRLRDARLAGNLTQAALANRLGRLQQFVSKYEAGERRLDIVEFIDVAAVLGLDWRSEIDSAL